MSEEFESFPLHPVVEIRCHCGRELGTLYSEGGEPILEVKGWRRGRRQNVQLTSVLNDNREDSYLLRCREHNDAPWRPSRDDVIALYEGVRTSSRKGVAIVRDGQVVALRLK